MSVCALVMSANVIFTSFSISRYFIFASTPYLFSMRDIKYLVFTGFVFQRLKISCPSIESTQNKDCKIPSDMSSMYVISLCVSP